jgi:TolB protein
MKMFLLLVLAAVAPQRITNVVDSYPQLSPDGTRLVFQSNRTGNWQLYVAKADGSEPRQVTNLATAVGPSWSPDGTRITFCAEPDGHADIFVMNADGSGVRRLTDHPGDDSHPHWSPDGKRIMFNSSRSTPDPKADWSKQWHEVFSMTPDGGDLRQHTKCRTVCTYPSFSPDMTRLTYRKVIDAPGMQWDLTLGARNSEVFVSNADGTNEVNISNSAAFDGWPTWSPDGKSIAFASNRSGPAYVGQIWLVSPDGKDLRRASDCPGGCVQPWWAADGKAIYVYQTFEDADHEYGNIARIDVR